MIKGGLDGQKTLEGPRARDLWEEVARGGFPEDMGKTFPLEGKDLE